MPFNERQQAEPMPDSQPPTERSPEPMPCCSRISKILRRTNSPGAYRIVHEQPVEEHTRGR